MGQAAVPGGCSTIEKCSSLGGDGGEREKINTNAPVELREKTYVTARADADTALPISVRSNITERLTPRYGEMTPGYEMRPPTIAEEEVEQAPASEPSVVVRQACPLPPEGLL